MPPQFLQQIYKYYILQQQMKQKNIFIYFLIIIVLVKTDFLPERLHIIDSHKTNFLVRGNLPIKNNQFQLDQLKLHLAQLTQNKNFNLKVYTLMNHLTEKESKNLDIEQRFFNQNPNAGTLYHHIILGAFVHPDSLPSIFTEFFAKYYDYLSSDKLDSFLQKLYQDIHTGENNLIYVHCSAGLDRTGLIYGAYLMKYYKVNLNYIYNKNKAIAGRQLYRFPMNGLIWYCKYLKSKNSEQNCEIKSNNQDQL